MLSNLELISSLQEDATGSVQRQRLYIKDLGAAILFLLHLFGCDSLMREAACVGVGELFQLIVQVILLHNGGMNEGRNVKPPVT